MWQDTEEARFERYEQYLKKCPLLGAASREVSRQSPPGGEAAGTRSGGADGRLPDRDEGKGGEEKAEIIGGVCDRVLAPALHSYVLWVLKEAMAGGKKRLYFLARDAFFMYEAAEKYCRAFDLPIECRYVSFSRYSVRIPLYQFDFDEALGYICRGGIDVTMDKILNRAGLAEAEKEKVLEELREKHSFSPDRQAFLPYAELAKIREMLEECEPFRTFVLQHSREALPAFEGYLTQEGLLDEIPMAVVDSGWVGSMQKLLNRAVRLCREQRDRKEDPETAGCGGEIRETGRTECGEEKENFLEGYYWGLYELPGDVDADTYHCYFFSPEGDRKEKVYFSNCLFEAVFSAPHGMTMGYCRKDGAYEPVYAEITAEHRKFMENIGERFSRYGDSLILETERQTEDEQGSGMKKFEFLASRMDRETVENLLGLFMAQPTRAEAEAFGSLPFSDDVIDYGGQELAAILSEEELEANHAGRKILSRLGIRNEPVRESAWYEGSAVRGGEHVSRHLRQYRLYKRLLYLAKR